MKKFLSLILFIIILLNSFLELRAQWQPVNLGPAGGEVYSVAVFGQDVFAGTTAGINRSTNYGATWTNAIGINTLCFASIGSNIFAGTATGVIISTDTGISWGASNPDMPYIINTLAVKDTILFAGTDGHGVFRSANNGLNWIPIDSGIVGIINDLAVLGADVYACTPGGLYISTDNGNHWSNLATSDNYSNQQMNCIAGNGSTIFVGTPGQLLIDNRNGWGIADTGLNFGTSIFCILINNSNVFIGTTSGVYMSTNNGESWVPASNGMPIPPKQIFSIASGPNGLGGTNLYAATNNGVYLSSNNGTSWTAENNGTVGTEVLSFTGSGPNMFAAIKGSPIFFSTNYGSTWNPVVDSGLNSGLFYIITVTGSGLYAVTDSGLFMSSNNGENWSSINGNVMDTVYPYNLVQSGSNLVVSTLSNGIFYSSNNGSSWKSASGNIPLYQCILSSIGPNIFSESFNGISLSTDNGLNWVELNDTITNEGLPVGLVSTGSTLFSLNEGNPLIVDTAGPSLGSLYSSTNNGKTWAPIITSGIPNIAFYYPITSFAVHGTDLFMVMESYQIYVSMNNGSSWENISKGLTGSEITALCVNDSSVFVGVYGSGIWKLPLSDIISAVKQPVFPSSAKSFMLWQNYPNPFNPSTIINYQLTVNGMVTLKVFIKLKLERYF